MIALRLLPRLSTIVLVDHARIVAVAARRSNPGNP